MTRKTLILLLLSLIASAASAATDWYKYSLYCDKIDQVVETSDKVYYLSGGYLFSYSQSDSESYAYTHINKLSDSDVSRLYYNNDKKYLAVVYTNSNIDILTDDGRTINLPEIKDSKNVTSKTINDMAFGCDRIAVATDFGIVIYNDERFEVIESGIYGQPINCIAIMDGKLIIYGHYATNYAYMYSPIEARHNAVDKFTKLFSLASSYFKPVADDVIAVREFGSNKLLLRKVNFDTNQYTNLIEDGDKHAYNYPIYAYAAGYYTLTADNIITFNSAGIDLHPIPDQLKGQHLTFYDSPSVIWAANPDGIAQYDISSATPTVLHDRMLYDNCSTVRKIGFMKWSKDGKRLYISNRGCSDRLIYAKGEGSSEPQTTNIVTNGGWVTNVSLNNASAVHSISTRMQNQFKSTKMFGDPLCVVEDPDDSDKYYCASYFEGVYVIKRNPDTGQYEEIGKFNSDNSTLTDLWGPRPMWLDIDPEGNLWVGHQVSCYISVLPAEKRRQDPATITKNDWRTHTPLQDLEYSHKDFTGLICRKSNMVFYAMGVYEGGFVAIDTKGTYADLDDDNIFHWSRVTDQDSNNISFIAHNCFLEDNRGCVWVGTSAGIYEITNPSKATSPDMTIRRIKVPRNDGTNYADYLLESENILWMALDPAGRKWVATENSGLYLVSETGDKILEHYDSTNSPLASNLVTAVECDKTDNTVYVGTTDGMYAFPGNATPPQNDYASIYAYPNPVRPEYSGMVNITGLMDNSVVKITDASGSVVFETRSEGGMAQWDACNRSGQRVNSGVYYVYASAYDGVTSNGATTKILVIN